jgi:asparagine synthase (glutamine-hydrolysing)
MIDKPKSGFQIPLNEWLRGDLKGLVEKYLDEEILDSKIFNIVYITALKDDFYKYKNDDGTQIWFILMFQMWKEKWLD